ncbi:MAG: cation transporter [Actinomycetota bacterium]
MTETKISVPAIHCDHCKMSLEGALGEVVGVAKAAVDIPSATITVSFDDPATMQDLVAAIEGQGYEVASGA